MGLRPPIPLDSTHRPDEFDCGRVALNVWLRRHAVQNQHAGATRTFVVTTGDGDVAGFYSLAAGSVEYAKATPRARKGLASHSVPVMVLARLAVDRRFQKRGLGADMVHNSILRTLAASEHMDVRAMLVYARDEQLKRFYEQFGFESCPLDPLRTMLLLKDAQSTLAASGKRRT